MSLLQILHLYVLPILVAVGPFARLIAHLCERSYPRLSGIARLFAGVGADPQEMARGVQQARGKRRSSLPALISADELAPRQRAPSLPDREPSPKHPSRPSWERPPGAS